jgi:hypothetical protein
MSFGILIVILVRIRDSSLLSPVNKLLHSDKSDVTLNTPTFNAQVDNAEDHPD